MLGRSIHVCVLFVMSLSAVAQTSSSKEPALSSKQQAIVDRKIAGLKSPGDRRVAGEWSNAKKVAEVLCRPVALSVLKRQATGVDRVFLGTADPHTLNLESNRRLTGSGQFRTPKGWREFTFTCELDPDTGKVTSFQNVPLSTKP